MARMAVIENDVVENVIVAPTGFMLPGKTLVATDTGQIGDAWDGKVFTPPPIDPRPAILSKIDVLEAKVTPRRQREALLTDVGKTWLADIDEQIAALRAQLP